LLGNRTLQHIFALDGRPVDGYEVVFSESPAAGGRSATRAQHHGDFDDDVPTMDSVLRRVLGVGDTAQIQSFADFRPRDASRGLSDPWTAPSVRQESLRAFLQANLQSVPTFPMVFASASDVAATADAEGSGFGRAPAAGAAGGRRRALCVGIDTYPTAPLQGCVADANLWASTLSKLGFERPAILLNEQATRAGILDALHSMVASGRRGDVLVFQYSGHGTQLPDLNGDEDDDKDEAFCPFDFASGAFLIDDDLGELFDAIPDGVNVTCFIDCCHSGSITRVAAGGPAGPPLDPTARRRSLAATPEMQQAHAEFRRRLGGSRAANRRVEPTMREVTFAACQPFEVAFESQGQGEFTRRATPILAAGIQGLSNLDFQQRVEAAFGSAGRQRPFLHCALAARPLRLLQALGGKAAVAPLSNAPAVTAPSSSEQGVANLLRSIAALLASQS
jgi:hypothetical protein